MSKKKIIIAAGGTAGHVYPATCVARRLSTYFDVFLATDIRGMRYIKKEELSSRIIMQNLPHRNRILLCFFLLLNTAKSLFFLIFNRPKCVIGFGGYPSIPFVLAAQLLRIDTILHEQNAVIGKANKFLFKMAKLTMLSFPIFPCPRNSTITGAPTRFEHMYDHFLYSPSVQNQFKILVLGGGQGSQNVSNSVLKSLAKMPKKALQNITVHHQAIKSDLDMVRKFYHQYGVKSNVQPFFSQIDDMYKDVDLVISRSGASTIFEIIGFKIPSILIPYEHSINGDQAANAQILRNVGAAVVCPDGDIFEALITLYNDRALLQKMSQNYLSLYIPCSTKKITELIADIITPQ